MSSFVRLPPAFLSKITTGHTKATHIVVTNDTGGGGVVWLNPVTDEEYNAGA